MPCPATREARKRSVTLVRRRLLVDAMMIVRLWSLAPSHRGVNNMFFGLKKKDRETSQPPTCAGAIYCTHAPRVSRIDKEYASSC